MLGLCVTPFPDDVCPAIIEGGICCINIISSMTRNDDVFTHMHVKFVNAVPLIRSESNFSHLPGYVISFFWNNYNKENEFQKKKLSSGVIRGIWAAHTSKFLVHCVTGLSVTGLSPSACQYSTRIDHGTVPNRASKFQVPSLPSFVVICIFIIYIYIYIYIYIIYIYYIYIYIYI